MNVPFALVLTSLVVQLGSKAPVAKAMRATTGRYDNHHPREQQALLQGAGKRALAAHANGWEAFPPFATGVLAATYAGVSPSWITALAAVHVVSRVGYVALYIHDRASARSTVWFLGFCATLALWALAAVGFKA